MLPPSLSDRLRAAHLHALADAWHVWLSDEANAGKSAESCLSFLLDAHDGGRADNRVKAFLRDARLGRPYGLCTFVAGAAAGIASELFDQLKTLSWTRLGQTVVITGPSRSGKTHLAAGLAREAVVQGLRTTLVQVPRMLDRLLDPTATKERKRYFSALCKVPLLVLEDFATEPASTECTVWLRRLLDERSRAGLPVVVTSINAISDWDRMFEDESSREGIYGRLLDEGCHRVELERRGTGNSVAQRRPKAGPHKVRKGKSSVPATPARA